MKLKIITQEEFEVILENHYVWLTSHRTEGDQANLSHCDLRELKFEGVTILQEANLQKAFLGDADLQEANLRNADLQGAFLENAELYKADLREANLSDTYL